NEFLLRALAMLENDFIYNIQIGQHSLFSDKEENCPFERLLLNLENKKFSLDKRFLHVASYEHCHLGRTTRFQSSSNGPDPTDARSPHPWLCHRKRNARHHQCPCERRRELHHRTHLHPGA